MKNKKQHPSLHFVPGGKPSGWTPVGLSGFEGLKPTATVRELIQNGFDAAVVANVNPARMRFFVSKCPTEAIPALEEYRVSFNKTQKSQDKLFKGNLPDNAKGIIHSIDRCLKKPEGEVLHVLDNGIGLNQERMNALLGDGISMKTKDSTGSFGNGHVVVFPSSDLRYVLYGGVTEQKMICAGHAILASSQDKGVALSEDGYLVMELKVDLFDRYVFASDAQIPALIKEQLQWIKKKWGHGSVVSVMGFNRFRENDALSAHVFQAASCNFFAAISKGRLVVDVFEDGKEKSLNDETLSDVLEKYKGQKKSRDGFMSGAKAAESLHTLKFGKYLKVQTDLGNVDVMLRHPVDSGATRVDLCRNGMWITNKLPKLQAHHFGSVQAFHGLILLQDNNEFSRLVRGSENPLHSEVYVKRLSSSEDKKNLRTAFGVIQGRLLEEVPKLESKTFRPDDVFVISTQGYSQGGARTGRSGTPVEYRRRASPPAAEVNDGNGHTPENGKGTKKNAGRPFNKSGKTMQFQALAVPTGPRSCQVNVVPGEKAAGSELRLTLDESIDETCDAFSRETFLHLGNVKLNGESLPFDKMTCDDKNNALGIPLGHLDQGQQCTIDVDYVVPGNLVPDDQAVVVKIDIVRRAAQKNSD